MGKTFIKDVLRPGIYPVDGEKVEVTAGDIQQMVSDFGELKSLGLRVSVPVEHPEKDDPDGYPVPSSDRARIEAREKSRLHGGWLDDLFIENGELKAKVDLGSDAAIEQAEKVGTFVSPQFGPWEAPNGKRFTKAMTHLALTTLPRNTNQSDKFVPVVALSQIAKTYRLSLADLAAQQIQMGDVPPAPAAPAPAATPTAAVPGATPGQPVPGQQSNDPIGQLRQALSALGITVSEGSPIGKDPEALASVLSCVTQHHGQQAANTPDPTKPTAGGKPGDVREEPRTVMMSQQTATTAIPATPAPATPAHAATPAAPVAQTPEQIQLSQQATEMAGLRERLTISDRKDYRSRIDAAFRLGKMDVPTRDRLYGLADTYQFSATPTKGELDFVLADRESLPEGAVWSDQQKAAQFSQVQSNGSFFTGDNLTPEQEEAIINRMHPGIKETERIVLVPASV